jgi:hypothetical protein
MQKITLQSLIILLSFYLNSCKKDKINDPLPTDGLVGYYNLNGNGRDAVQPANDGLTKNVTPTTDRFNKENSAFQFDGISSSIQLPNEQFKFKNFTYSAWVKYDVIPTNQTNTQGVGVILSVGYLYGAGDHCLVLANTKVKGWGLWTYTAPYTDGNYAYEGQLPSDTSKWYHIVATRSQKELKIYVDSKLVASQLNLSGEAAYDTKGTLAFIGNRVDGSLHFKGKIDDVRIYNRVLGSTEVISLYNEISK